jgi:hypothetical protein
MELDFEKLAGEAFLAPENYITAQEAISPELIGLRMFDPPIFGVADAADPMFEGLRGPEAIGPHFRLPADWLPEARRVVSFFLPYSREVKRPNEAERREPSASWLHGRIEGHRFLLQFARKLRTALEEGGERALIPGLEKDFAAVEHDGPAYAPFGPGVAFTSNWSERHVAHICGLGTFA